MICTIIQTIKGDKSEDLEKAMIALRLDNGIPMDKMECPCPSPVFQSLFVLSPPKQQNTSSYRNIAYRCLGRMARHSGEGPMTFQTIPFYVRMPRVMISIADDRLQGNTAGAIVLVGDQCCVALTQM